LTLGEVEKIAPDAIWRLDISSHATRSAFPHSLDPKRTSHREATLPESSLSA